MTNLMRDSSMVAMFRAMTSDTKYGSFFFTENTTELSMSTCYRPVSRPTCYGKNRMLFSNKIIGSVDKATRHAREKCFYSTTQ
jgi:hypothetical protein